MNPNLIASLGKMGGQAKGSQGQPPEVPPNQLMPGESGGHTQFALQAIQSLHKYLEAITDANEIAVIRSVILILNKLVETDQQQQMGQLPTDVQTMQGQQSGMGGGSPMPMGMGQ